MPNTFSQIYLHFVFSVKYRQALIPKTHKEELHKYINNQEEHHKKTTFREEYTGLLKKFDIAFEDKYLFEFFD